jgi:Uma2 family endonuclease
MPERPAGRPISVRPDFICEVLSESNAATDEVDKFRVYASSGVPFYWIGDPQRRILTACSPFSRVLPSAWCGVVPQPAVIAQEWVIANGTRPHQRT